MVPICTNAVVILNSRRQRSTENLSYKFKVNEFASLMRQSSCPGAKGDKPNNVWSDLKRLRVHTHLPVR